MTNYQRKGASSNAHVGGKFEERARSVLDKHGLKLQPNHKVKVGIDLHKKDHAFDLGSEDPTVIVECKAHTWTKGNNVPSAKMTNWVEAMYYFQIAPDNYKKIFFVEKNKRRSTKETLLEYFLRTYKHMIPPKVEFWELDGITVNFHKNPLDSKEASN